MQINSAYPGAESTFRPVLNTFENKTLELQDTHKLVSAIPNRRNQRKCDATPDQTDACSLYLNPNSLQVCSTSLEMAG